MEAEAAIPLGVAMAVLLVNCAESVNICFLFPFMAFMLEDFGYSGHRLGFYCGALAASFCSGQFCSSYVWGWLSDKYGRKPTLVIGTLGTAVGTAVFGFALSFPQAVLGRVLSGILSGNLGVLKTYLTEISSDNNRTKAFALLQTSGSIGNIIGPLIGGMLASPSKRYPLLFPETSVWGRYPYLFPCMLCVANSICASVMCALFLKETKKWPSTSNSSGSSSSSSSSSSLDSSSHPLVFDSPLHSSRSRETEEDTESSLGRVSDTNIPSHKRASAYVIVGEDEGEDESSELEVGGAERQGRQGGGKEKSTTPETQAESAALDLGEKGAAASASVSEERDAEHRVLSDPVVLMTTGAYGLLCFSYIILDETLPLYMKLETNLGGMSFKSHEIGFILSCSGAVMLLFNVLILPKLGGMSKLQLYRYTNALAIPFTMAWPLAGQINEHLVATGYLAKKSTAMYVMLLLISSVKNSLGVMTFTAVIILVNNSVPSAYLGKVNGFGQSLAALARAVGPALGGSLWSVSLRTGFVYLNFMMCSCMLVLGQCLVSLLPESLDLKQQNTTTTTTTTASGSASGSGLDDSEHSTHPLAVQLSPLGHKPRPALRRDHGHSQESEMEMTATVVDIDRQVMAQEA